MAGSTFIGRLLNKSKRQTINVSLDIIEFQEDNLFYSYSPALDLMGYGNNSQEARESWEVVLEAYIGYAMNKGTLLEDMQKHGWIVKSKHKPFTPPTFSWMLQNNSNLSEMYNKHNFNKVSLPVSMPYAYA